jgi:hypothetical protein
MEEKHYPVIEGEDGTDKCSEPAVGYAATGSGYANTVEQDEESPQIPVGKLGFYTDNPDEFEARVSEIEADLDEVETGHEDPEKWMTSEQFNQELFRVFPWLQ